MPFSITRDFSAIFTDWSVSKSPPDAVTVSVWFASTPLGEATTSRTRAADRGSRDGSPAGGAGDGGTSDAELVNPLPSGPAESFGALSLKNAVTVTCARV